MTSKNISIVIETLDEHINQVIALNNTNQSQIEEIDEWIVQRERALATCVAGFREYLHDHEKSHPKNRKWHKTLKVAEEYLKNYTERG